LTLRHQFTRGDEQRVNPSLPTRINFANNGFTTQHQTHSFAAELNTAFSSTAANDFIIGFTSVLDDRDPLGGDFPFVNISDPGGNIRLGTDGLSTANSLEQRVFTITNNLQLYQGKHTLTFGTHNEFSNFNYLFIRQNYGVYEFSSLTDFLAGNNAERFFRTYALTDETAGDDSDAAANFSAMQLGFYAQDEWEMGPRFTFTYGLRLDLPSIQNDPVFPNNFTTTTLPSLLAAHDLADVADGTAPKGQLMWSPRLGFAFQPNAKTNIRGGAGVFTSRLPFVWPSGSYVNNGQTIGSVFLLDQPFEPNVQNQPIDPDFATPAGQVDLFAQDFRNPQVLRASLALDRNFSGWDLTLEGVYTRTLNDITYTNLNTDPTVNFTWTGTPDNRPIFTGNRLNTDYSAIYLISNTQAGNAYNLTASVSKQLTKGLSFFAAYNYSDANTLLDGTSSQNSSQWDEAFSINGRNDAVTGRSVFSVGSRALAFLSYEKAWNRKKSNVTRISLFYEGRSGQPFSYVYGGRDARNLNAETGSVSRRRSLIWIPADASEINLVDPSQWSALDAYIEANEELKAQRGGYASKNSGRTPFTQQLDLRIAQTFGIKTATKTHKFQLSADIFNLANLFSSSAGVVYDNPFAFSLIDFEGYAADGTTPQFSFAEERLGAERFTINDRLSRWRMRLGVRYIFD
ncbi:MAG: TonB-dependent receptor, partial [Bacteroidota bacterium]